MKPTWLFKNNKLKLNDELTAKKIELNNNKNSLNGVKCDNPNLNNKINVKKILH